MSLEEEEKTENNPQQKQLQKQTLQHLDQKRQSLELEGQAIISELTAVPEGGGACMGIDTPLVDQDGYPRADVDVYRARTLRQRLAVIRTDHQALMKQLDQGLTTTGVSSISKQTKEEEQAELQARKAVKPKPKFDPVSKKWVVPSWDGSIAGVAGGERRSFDHLTEETPTATRPESVTTPSASSLTPFGQIDAVAAESPAAQAGLQEGDLICQFGSVNATNHRNLLAIGELVPQAASHSQEIALTIQRKATRTTSSNGSGSDVQEAQVMLQQLTLRPRPWNGRGLLGCHVTPYTPPTDHS